MIQKESLCHGDDDNECCFHFLFSLREVLHLNVRTAIKSIIDINSSYFVSILVTINDD